MNWLIDSILSWSFFWVVYYVISLFFDDYKIKSINQVTWDDLLHTVSRNMYLTSLFQPIFFYIIPYGILNPQYTVYRFIISAIVTEIIFFYTHKLLHCKSLYKYHEKHHRFIEPCALSALYCSGLEAIFSNHLSIVVGPLITGMQTSEIVIWFGLCALNTLKAHSGFNRDYFNSRYHDLHHSKRSVNFGFLYLLDIFHGTCELPQKNKRMKE